MTVVDAPPGPDDFDCEGDTPWKVIRCLVSEYGDDYDKIVLAFRERPDALDLIGPLVRWCAVGMNRQPVRRVEQAARAELRRAATTAPAPVRPALVPFHCKDRGARQVTTISGEEVHAWRLLAKAKVDIPVIDADGGVLRWERGVYWHDVTVAQHRARARWLRGNAEQTFAVARQHETAATRCEGAGVDTLKALLALTPAAA